MYVFSVLFYSNLCCLLCEVQCTGIAFEIKLKREIRALYGTPKILCPCRPNLFLMLIVIARIYEAQGT